MPSVRPYAGICAIAKDEDAGLRHWTAYHFAIGFERIFLFDNNSRTSIRDLLADYVSQGLVLVQEVREKQFPQLSAYATFLKELKNFARWVAFIDIDEYINLKSCSDICDLLAAYEKYPALGANWKVFGSNGHISRPFCSPLEAYTSCIQDHGLIKSIVQPEMTSRVVSPHHFRYVGNKTCVNEHCIPIFEQWSYHTAEQIQINHYYYKSQQDYEEKMRRGYATPVLGSQGHELEKFYEQARRTGTIETSILRFAKKVNPFERQGPSFIASAVKRKTAVDVDAVLQNASAKLSQGKTAEAAGEITRALRYQNAPLLHVALARLTAATDKAGAFGCMGNALLAAGHDQAQRIMIFKELAALYGQLGLPSQRDSILSSIPES